MIKPPLLLVPVGGIGDGSNAEGLLHCVLDDPLVRVIGVATATPGVPGLLIVVDPPTEGRYFLPPHAKVRGFGAIRLVALTIGDARLTNVLEGRSGGVELFGIIGIARTRSAAFASNMLRHRCGTDRLVGLGVGVKTPTLASEEVPIAAAAVVAFLVTATLAASIVATLARIISLLTVKEAA